jgi:hypothetical protein
MALRDLWIDHAQCVDLRSWHALRRRRNASVAVSASLRAGRLSQPEEQVQLADRTLPFKVRSILLELHTGPTRRSMKR